MVKFGNCILLSMYTYHKVLPILPHFYTIKNHPSRFHHSQNLFPYYIVRTQNSMYSYAQHSNINLLWINGFHNKLFEYNVLYLFIFHYKVYNKRVSDIVISFKKRDSLSLRMDLNRASYSFDPNRDSNKSSFLDLINISITLLEQAFFLTTFNAPFDVYGRPNIVCILIKQIFFYTGMSTRLWGQVTCLQKVPLTVHRHCRL